MMSVEGIFLTTCVMSHNEGIKSNLEGQLILHTPKGHTRGLST